MSKTKELFLSIVLIFTFTLLFNQIFHLRQTLMFIFPDGAFNYPRPKTVNNGYVFFLKFLLVGIIPISLSVFFILKTKLLDRVTKNWGLTLLIITVIIYLARYGLLYGSTFIRGGGPTYVLVHLFSYLNIPLKVMLIVGLLKSLLSLTEYSSEQPFFKPEKLSSLILVLGMWTILSLTLQTITTSGLIGRVYYLLGMWIHVIYFIIVILIIYKVKLHKKVANNYGIYLLGISTLIYYVNNFFLVIYISKYIPEPNSDVTFFSDFIHYYSIFNLFVIFALITSFLKICLTLKPLETEK